MIVLYRPSFRLKWRQVNISGHIVSATLGPRGSDVTEALRALQQTPGAEVTIRGMWSCKSADMRLHDTLPNVQIWRLVWEGRSPVSPRRCGCRSRMSYPSQTLKTWTLRAISVGRHTGQRKGPSVTSPSSCGRCRLAKARLAGAFATRWVHGLAWHGPLLHRASARLHAPCVTGRHSLYA